MTAVGVLGTPARVRAIRLVPALVNVLLAWIAVLAIAGGALIIAADAAIGWSGVETVDVAVFAVAFPALPVVGALLARRRPANAIGWLFLGASLTIAGTAFAHGYGDYALDARPGALPGAAFAAWWQWVGWVGFAALAVFVPLLYPDGRLPSARWRPLAIAGVVATAGIAATLALRPGSLPDFHHAENPFGAAALAGPLDAVDAVTRPLFLLVLAGALVSLVVRYRTGSTALRAQLTWLAAATAVLVAADVVGTVLLGWGVNDHPGYCTWGTAAAKPVYGMVVPALLYAGLPVAVAVAVLRQGLYDLDRVIRRSAVYATLWAAIALAYVVLAWSLGVAVTGRLPIPVAVALTIAATLAFSPARQRLERVADRWAFGDRPSTYEVAADFGATSGTATDLESLTSSLAEIVRSGLGVTWARVRLGLPDGKGCPASTRTAGHPGGAPDLVASVRHAGRELGSIECGPPVDPRRRSENVALLDLLAQDAGLAVHTMGLARSLSEQVRTVDAQAAELAASRARIVAAQEAERRRVERDIHDGAQQDLVALLVKLRITRELMRRDPDAAATTLDDLHRDAKSALVAVRELAQGIHPSVLADEGLVAALEGRAGRLPLDVRVVGGNGTRDRRFPDAVEGGAYFVASEALANVLKHADAGRATVRVATDATTLTVEITDDGRGFTPGGRGGQGLTNLADRVAALGGTLDVRSAPGEGTTLTARLPIPCESP